MKNILILGANSYVGYYLSKSLNSMFKIVGLSRKELNDLPIEIVIGDSTNLELVKNLITDHEIDTIINCVCLGNVDECEKNQQLAYDINYKHVTNLTTISRELNIKLVHFSSNAVYSGDHPLYGVDSPKEPKNYYGNVKAMADDHIKKNLRNYLLVRVMTLFGNKENFHRHNPGSMIISALLSNKPLKLVNDLYSNVLFIDDLINFVHLALEKDLSGEFNLSGDEIVNRFELGLKICEIMDLPKTLITECSSDEFPSLTKRAPNTSFDNSKAKSALSENIITPLRKGIEKTVERMRNANN